MAVATFVTFRSNFTPVITFDPNKKDTNPIRSGVLNILQPSIDVSVPVVGNIHYAPYGEPSGYGLIVIYSVIALAAYGLYRILK